MERPIFHLRWEREAFYRRKQNQTKQKTTTKNAHTPTHTHCDTHTQTPHLRPHPHLVYTTRPLTIASLNTLLTTSTLVIGQSSHLDSQRLI